MPKITAVYVRVSSRKQDTESQEPDLKRWIAGDLDVLRGDTIVKWYRDKFTGRSLERKGFQALMSDVEAGLVERIVVFRLDRLGRTAKGLTALFEDLTKRKVNLISLRDTLELHTPAGRLMACVLASVAAYESEIKSENILAGLEVARAKGTKLGRPVVGSGMGTRIKVTSEQEELVKSLASQGKPKAAIARAVGLSRVTVYSILQC